MKLSDTELLRLENIQLRRQNLMMQASQLNTAEAKLRSEIEDRLGINLAKCNIGADGTITAVDQDVQSQDSTING